MSLSSSLSSYARPASLLATVSIGVALAALPLTTIAAAEDSPATTQPLAPPQAEPQLQRLERARRVIVINGDGVAEVTDDEPPQWRARKPATQPVAEATLGAWFADLAASDAAARDAAFGHLLDLSRADLAGLRRVVERARPVAPAQAHALRDVVTHVYLSGETYPAEPRSGFLGLREPVVHSVEVPSLPGERPLVAHPNVLGLARTNTGVPVEHRIPGFCAFGALRDGDVVLSIQKPAPHPLSDWTELTLTLRRFPAGQTLTLEVLRQGAVLAVPVTLDARLVVPNERVWLDEILPAREAAAAAYWTQHFAPLIEERLSRAD